MTKKDLLTLLKKEYSTTVKVLQAYPEGKDDLKPHEKSSDALKLAKTFVFEMYLTGAYVFGDVVDRDKFSSYNPGTVKKALKDFQKETDEVIARLEKLREKDLEKEVDFGGKKFIASNFLLMMICDQIHHRGQLTVYIRLAGGLVPSIYGPSADDPSTNL